MKYHRCIGRMTVVVAAVVISIVSSACDVAETVETEPEESNTPWGDPDLQGFWYTFSNVPLERPDPEAERRVWTQVEREAEEGLPSTGTYNRFWSDDRPSTERQSLVIDPADGRLPPMQAEAQAREKDRLEARTGRGDFDSYEDRHRWERCVTLGLPILPTVYNSTFQILQTPGHVAILQEMIHEARIIPLDGRPHQDVKGWFGDSRGHWEGSTLVVETINFNDKLDGGPVLPARQGAFPHLSVHRGSGATLRLVERFTRVNAETLNYEFTVEDSATWTQPWTAMVSAVKIDDAIFEYACHEGNYGLRGILAGGRMEEK